MTARPDGFHLAFTRAVDEETAGSLDSYKMSSYTYLLHSDYGSPEVEVETLAIAEVKVDEDRMGAHLVVEGLREGYVHELHLDGVRSAEGGELLHPRAYYTLIRRPKSR